MFKETIAFIKELYPSKDFISLHEPVFRGNEKTYTANCIDSTFVSSVGEYVNRFEVEMIKYTQIPYAVACVNGTAALHMSLLIAGVQQDDEVLTQALTFVATANAISYCKAHSVFIDSDLKRLGMSVESLRNFLEEFADVRNDGQCYNKKTGRRIKACVPMHVFGHPVDIDGIAALCKKYSIVLVEDCAESLGSFYKNKHTGAFSHVSAISFNGNKTITTGGGGMLLFNEEKLAKRAKHLTTTAKVPHQWEFVHDEVGYNYRLPNINAALGVAQMEYLPEILSNKRKTADLYRDFFKTKDCQFVAEPEDSKSNYWLNAIILNSKEEREQFLEQTNKNGVMTRPVWALMSELKHFSNCQYVELKNAQLIRERLVNIPSGYRIAGLGL